MNANREYSRGCQSITISDAPSLHATMSRTGEESHDIGNMFGYGSPEFLYFYRSKLSPAFRQLSYCTDNLAPLGLLYFLSAKLAESLFNSFWVATANPHS